MMKLKFFFTFVMAVLALNASGDVGQQINIEQKPKHGTHLENFVPFDMPDVFYDDVSQAIIIDGGGVVTYYDVEIAPVTSSVPVITTQVSGYYDTIDVSSLPATEYVITIYSPENNTYEGFFEIE